MRIAPLYVLVLVVACGGGDSDGVGSVPVSQLGAELAEISCARYATCCTTEEFMEQTLGAEDEAECRALFTGLLGILLIPVLEDSIAAGRVVYHPDRMGACLEAIRSLSCLEGAQGISLESGLDGCEDPFEGQVAHDDTCANDFDCVSEYCSGASIDFQGNITYGACTDAPSIGAPCDDGDCASGAYCDRIGPTPTCQALLADGSECTFDDHCASDACDDNVCGTPTTCDGVD